MKIILNQLNRIKLFFIFFSFVFRTDFLLYAQDFINLEDRAQDFVLETKKIEIPGFAGAFNPAIVQWRDGILMCFRVRNAKLVSTFQMAFVWLDKDFNPISVPSVLAIRENSSDFSTTQDPRLIVVNQRLYIVYSNAIKIDNMVTRKMFFAQVHHENNIFFIENPRCLFPFDGWSSRWEKNWVPFNYQKNLLLAYSILPHRIFQPDLASGSCTTIDTTQSTIQWPWGELRGGTPALLDGDHYLGFFHSSKKMATVHSQGQEMPHYVIGAYTFSRKPPFVIKSISPEPIVGLHFYEGQEYTTWKPLRVVFPVGYIFDENYIWLSYGRQDFEIWVVKIDKKGLYKSMVSCFPNKFS